MSVQAQPAVYFGRMAGLSRDSVRDGRPPLNTFLDCLLGNLAMALGLESRATGWKPVLLDSEWIQHIVKPGADAVRNGSSDELFGP